MGNLPFDYMYSHDRLATRHCSAVSLRLLLMFGGQVLGAPLVYPHQFLRLLLRRPGELRRRLADRCYEK